MMIDKRFICVVDSLLTNEECAEFIKFVDSQKLHLVKSTLSLYERNGCVVDYNVCRYAWYGRFFNL
jgi:hypothetical protein